MAAGIKCLQACLTKCCFGNPNQTKQVEPGEIPNPVQNAKQRSKPSTPSSTPLRVFKPPQKYNFTTPKNMNALFIAMANDENLETVNQEFMKFAAAIAFTLSSTQVEFEDGIAGLGSLGSCAGCQHSEDEVCKKAKSETPEWETLKNKIDRDKEKDKGSFRVFLETWEICKNNDTDTDKSKSYKVRVIHFLSLVTTETPEKFIGMAERIANIRFRDFAQKRFDQLKNLENAKCLANDKEAENASLLTYEDA